MEPDAPDLLNLHMLKGTRGGLKETFSMLISASTAKALFGDADPMSKVIRMNDKLDAKVTGVYEDFPRNSNFANVNFISTWELKKIRDPWMAHNGLGQ